MWLGRCLHREPQRRDVATRTHRLVVGGFAACDRIRVDRATGDGNTVAHPGRTTTTRPAPTPTTRPASTTKPASTSQPPPVNTPPQLFPSFGLLNGTGVCVAPSDAIKVVATATDPDGIAKVTGAFFLRRTDGSTTSSPPTTMTLKSNGIYVYPNIDLRAGTYTITVTATDTTGLARTATADIVSASIAPGLCSISSVGWTYSP
ncbi:MAG TPA: hypothetical protein VH561_21570 [Micromonosporaceae bacterium]